MSRITSSVLPPSLRVPQLRVSGMRVNKALKVLLFGLFGLYVVYVAGAAIFLNTSLFAQVADMKNEDQTYVRLHGAFSPFPGWLFVSSGRVFISDQNVSIGIDVKDIRARFAILPFLQKRAEILDLHIKETKVNIGMKTLEETVAYQAKYVKPEDLDLKKRAEKIKEFETSHLTLAFPKIQIDSISEIKSDLGEFKGELALTGGFIIQPKVQVEVFPTTLKFYKGQIPDQFSSVQGEAKVRIDRFRMIDAPGNAVFPYFNADLRLDIGLKSLKLLDLSLRKLPGYSFEGTDTRLSVRGSVIKGKLQKESNVTATPTQLTINTPGISAMGFGKVKWEVQGDDTSRFSAHLSRVKMNHHSKVRHSDAVMAGTLKNLDLNMKLYGTELVNAFHGALIDLKLNGLRWNLDSDTKNPNLQYHGLITGGGSLGAYSGEVPESVKKDQGKASDLNLKMEHLKFKTSFISNFEGQGSINVFAHSIDLGTGTVRFPKVDANLDLTIDKYGVVKTQAHFKNLEHRLYPDESWKGQLEWTMDQTSPLIDALVNQDRIGGFLGMFARVKHLLIRMDCEIGEDNSWMRFNEVSSDGLWKAYGTLTNDEDGMRGVFETKVLNLPIGIRVQPDQTDVRFLPSAEWYDESQPGSLRGVQ